MPWLCPLRVSTSFLASTYTTPLARLSASSADSSGTNHSTGLR